MSDTAFDNDKFEKFVAHLLDAANDNEAENAFRFARHYAARHDMSLKDLLTTKAAHASEISELENLRKLVNSRLPLYEAEIQQQRRALEQKNQTIGALKQDINKERELTLQYQALEKQRASISSSNSLEASRYTRALPAPVQRRPNEGDEFARLYGTALVLFTAVAIPALIVVTLPNEITAAGLGLGVGFCTNKAAKDFNLHKSLRYSLNAVPAVAAAIGIGLLDDHHVMEGALPQALWMAKGALLATSGFVLGSYIGLRDKVQSALGPGTFGKMAFGAVLFTAGVAVQTLFPQSSSAAAILSGTSENGENKTAYVVTERLNARSAPSKAGKILSEFNCGASLVVTRAADPNWSEIILPDARRAYVSTRFTSPRPPTDLQCRP